MLKLLKQIFVLVWLGSLCCCGAFANKKAPLIDLPLNAELKFKVPFTVDKENCYHGLKTIEIDLKGDSEEARASRVKFADVVAKLAELKNFGKLGSVYCVLYFEQPPEPVTIPKGQHYGFARPREYGSPTKHTVLGERIMLDTTHESTISADFLPPPAADAPVLRRLYCALKAGPELGWGTDFVNDMKIYHLEALLSRYFELVL